MLLDWGSFLSLLIRYLWLILITSFSNFLVCSFWVINISFKISNSKISLIKLYSKLVSFSIFQQESFFRIIKFFIGILMLSKKQFIFCFEIFCFLESVFMKTQLLLKTTDLIFKSVDFSLIIVDIVFGRRFIMEFPISCRPNSLRLSS